MYRRSEVVLEAGVESKLVMVFGVVADSTEGVFADTLFEEVSFALKANQVHKRERIGDSVRFGLIKFYKEAISAESDVLAHEGRIHPH